MIVQLNISPSIPAIHAESKSSNSAKAKTKIGKTRVFWAMPFVTGKYAGKEIHCNYRYVAKFK